MEALGRHTGIQMSERASRNENFSGLNLPVLECIKIPQDRETKQNIGFTQQRGATKWNEER